MNIIHQHQFNFDSKLFPYNNKCLIYCFDDNQIQIFIYEDIGNLELFHEYRFYQGNFLFPLYERSCEIAIKLVSCVEDNQMPLSQIEGLTHPVAIIRELYNIKRMREFRIRAKRILKYHLMVRSNGMEE